MGIFKFSCPYCSQRMEIDETEKGKNCNCPNCNREIVICDDYACNNTDDSIGEMTNPAHEKSVDTFNSSTAGKKRTHVSSSICGETRQSLANSTSVFYAINKIFPLLIIILLCIIIALMSWPQKWEYKAVKISGNITEHDYKIGKFFPINLEDNQITSKIQLIRYCLKFNQDLIRYYFILLR